MDIAEFRAQFPALSTRAYLFSGALAPAAAPVRKAWDAWSDAWSQDPNAVYTEAAMIGEMAALRAAFAGLIGARAGEVALTDNTCRATNIAVRILEARPRTNVVVDDSTYPASVYPWRAHGRHDVRYVPTNGVDDAVAAIAAQIDDETLAVCITHVAPFSGRRHDVRAIADAAHAHGALLLVDAAQSTGVVPIDVRDSGIDLLVATGMKWLLGPPGIGYLYVSPEVLAEAPVLDVGYIGLDAPIGDWPVDRLPPIASEARRYELGLPSLPALAASRAGIELLLAVGIERIAAHVESLVSRCIDGLIERGADVLTPTRQEARAGVIAFRSERPTELFEACRADAVDIGTLIGGVRVDPHGFNSEDDIDRFLVCYDRFQSQITR
jgi:selenocysteine lyase/cysteine desulfurase